MKCQYENCILEVEADWAKVRQFLRVENGVSSPRRNSVKLVTNRRDHPLGLPKPDADLGGVYFEWLSNASFQKVRLHLVREYGAQDPELVESVDGWLKRKLDELWIVSGEPIHG
jgi:hypothetical protein